MNFSGWPLFTSVRGFPRSSTICKMPQRARLTSPLQNPKTMRACLLYPNMVLVYEPKATPRKKTPVNKYNDAPNHSWRLSVLSVDSFFQSDSVVPHAARIWNGLFTVNTA
jgi:hypothetical protein